MRITRTRQTHFSPRFRFQIALVSAAAILRGTSCKLNRLRVFDAVKLVPIARAV